MSRIIGNKNAFAVEYALDENDLGPELYGQSCFWIKGKRVGNYEVVTRLSDIMISTVWMIHDNSNRHGEFLCPMSVEEIFSRLDQNLYGYGYPDLSEDEIIVPDTPARFDVTIHSRSFDSWKFFLVECENAATLIYKNLKDKLPVSVHLKKGEFDEVIRKFHEELENLENHELQKKN